MVEPLLFELENVSFGFGGSRAIDGLSLQIKANGCIGLLGCNGAGKSTLLHILAGLVQPISGSIKWRKKELSDVALRHDSVFRAEFRRKVGIVFQDSDAQFLCDSVIDEVAFGPMQIWDRDEANARVDDAMQVMGLSHLVNQPPYTLSGGEKRRVALASVIAMDPEVLLLDEPTASLDAATADFLLDWLEAFVKRDDKTVIMATHDLALVGDLADRCIVLTPCHRLAMTGAVSGILSDHELLKQMNLIGRRKATSLHSTGL